MSNKNNNLKCLNCDAPIHVEELVLHKVGEQIKLEAEKKAWSVITLENKKVHEIAISEAKEEAVKDFEEENKSDVLELTKLREEKLTFERERRKAINLGKEEALKEFQKISKNDNEEISKLKNEVLSNKLKEKQYENSIKELEKIRDNEVKLATQIEVQKEKSRLETKYGLDIQARENEINTLKKAISEAERKSNQQSVQSQGETGELHIERKLKEEFPNDQIVEIKKGQNGADTMHYVFSSRGKKAGLIYIESKNTENFQNSWIGKLKSDMIEKKAHIGILITNKMPSYNDKCHFKDGIWICGFHEFLSIVKPLRFHLIESIRLMAVKEMTSEKSKEIFSYITSLEFNSAMEKMLAPIMNQKIMFETEKRAIRKSWAAREKFIEQSLEGADLIWGSLRALAGPSMPGLAIMDEVENIGAFEDNLIDINKKN